MKGNERESWRNDIWGLHAGAQILSSSICTLTVVLGGTWGSGFKPSWYMTGSDVGDDSQRLVRVRSWFHTCSSWLTSILPQSAYESDFDTPHMIVTYAALVTLAILRDDFTRLDRRGLVTFLRSSQHEDGRFVCASVEIS